ncbi:MAG TPA: hypothetical protein PK595_09515, partial [Bacteroidota bacterium]|nr:hypothetical protein [Bacteroidota bacterium]
DKRPSLFFERSILNARSANEAVRWLYRIRNIVSERLLNAGHPLVVTLNYALEVLPRYAFERIGNPNSDGG